MTVPFVLCDVFADRPFTGNQLAVFLNAEGMDVWTMKALAREFNWSEITFVLPGDPPRVRIWTPDGELPFAGHPTIGTAVVLAAEGVLPQGPNTLLLGIGPIQVDVRGDEHGGEATMTQRAPDFGAVYMDRGRLAHALGLPESALIPELPAQLVSTGLPHFLVPVRTAEDLAAAAPVATELPGVLHDLGARWAYVFTPEAPGCGVAARTRLLGVGMEDAATGSAAGPLGAYLVYYGLHRPGDLVIHQGVEMGRPSVITVTVQRIAGEIAPVQVTGSVRIWGHGQFGG